MDPELVIGIIALSTIVIYLLLTILSEQGETQTPMEPQSRTFNLTETQLNEVRTILKDKYGMALVGDNGNVNKGGLKATFDISHDVNDVKDDASLTITLTELPILISPENAWGIVAGTVNEARKKFKAVG